MGIWGKLKGAAGAVKGAVGSAIGLPSAAREIWDTAAGIADKLHFSPEERAKFALEQGRQMIEWQKATQGQNVTRRLLAMTLVGVWMLHHLIWVSLGVAHAWAGDERLEQAAAIVRDSTDEMNQFVGWIIAFYFVGTQVVQGLYSWRNGKREAGK